MFRDVASLVKPRTVAVVGASARRSSQGNVVIQNLLAWGFSGQIVPVHPSAAEIDGIATLNAIDALPRGVDTAIVAVPAADVLDTLVALEAAGVCTANVFSNGFSADDQRAIVAFGRRARMSINGPNCMGLVNFTDAIPLYPSRPSLRLKAGPIALVAQSGSAAISVMNTLTTGLSKVVTVGSEFQLAAADYLNWFSDDDATRAVGVVAESIKDPLAFARAAERLHAAGKALVVLKVGNSDMGAEATRAHTGALVSSRDAFDDYFNDCDIATVRDYDELVASLEAAVVAKRMARGGRIAIAGISGGQTALACDVAAARGITLAEFSPATCERVHQALPGSAGANPVDIGATVLQQERNAPLAFAAILDDPDVGALVLLQDCQASLNPRTHENYMNHIPGYGKVGNTTEKPVVMVSPTGESIHPGIADAMAGTPVPIVRGLLEGLVAIDNLGKGHPEYAAAWGHLHRRDQPAFNPAAAQWREKLSGLSGNVPAETCFDILRSYGVPVVRSAVAATPSDAVGLAEAIGFPMVVKVVSRHIGHRSDVGGVVLDVQDVASMQRAIADIARNVSQAAPNAVIDGYELQEQISGDAEVLVGFTAAPPFGSLMVVGAGGTMVEILDDRAVSLAPLTLEKARRMMGDTRVGKLLLGYRNLMQETDLGSLLMLLKAVSEMARDLGDRIGACDLNPVLVKKGTGEIRVVDALMQLREPDANDGELRLRLAYV